MSVILPTKKRTSRYLAAATIRRRRAAASPRPEAAVDSTRGPTAFIASGLFIRDLALDLGRITRGISRQLDLQKDDTKQGKQVRGKTTS